MKASRVSRRRFLRRASAAVAAPWVVPASVLGAEGRTPPSERITMGFIGLGGQGSGHIGGGAWTYLPGGYLATDDVQVLGVCDVRLYRSTSHSRNFLDCVRTRERTICDARTAHRAASVMLLGGIAGRLGRPLRWNPTREEFADDDEANRLRYYALREPWRA